MAFETGGYGPKRYWAKLGPDGFLQLDPDKCLEEAIAEERYEDAAEIKAWLDNKDQPETIVEPKGYDLNLSIPPINTFIATNSFDSTESQQFIKAIKDQQKKK